MSHYSWSKESRTLDKKLNGKKTSEIKKFYWERDIFKPSKAKKAIIYKENDFGFISEIKKTQHFNILSISWDSFGFLELGVVLNLT